MKGIILYCCVLFSTLNCNSQILVGEPIEKTKIKKEKAATDTIPKREIDGSTSVYFVSNWSVTNRLLKVNGSDFGDSLGIRADEKSLKVWSFGMGFQNKLNKSLMWDGGIAFMRNGETYNFVGADSTYSSQTYYNYISMPVRLNYTVGNDIKFYAGAGLVPQMFMGYRKESQWTTPTNSSDKETFKTKSGYNSFVLSAVFNIGVTLNFQNNWALVVSPEARIQMTSSYMKQDSYIHKGRAYGITFGLIRNL